MARGMLVLRLDEGRLVVAHGERDDYCVHLPTLPAADFPSPLVVDLPWRFDLPASALRDLLGRTRHAISKDEHRYYLNSVCLEVEGDRLLAVATDGHRLARVCTEAVPGCEALPTGERALLVPREVVALLHDLAGRWDGERVWIEAGPERMAWGFGAVRIAARLIEGKFADWRRVIPEPAACSATLRRGPLLHALERVRMAGAVGVHLRCRAGEMEIEARCDGVRALATVPAEVVGEWPDRMVNRRYLADLVRQVRGGLTLVPAAGDAPDVIPRGQPGALRVHDSADPRALYLLMPMRA
jgi:DNA polymerase-3 subunit beta